MLPARCDLRHAAQVADEYRSEAIRERTIPKLAGIVPPPTSDTATGKLRAGVSGARRDIFGPSEPDDCDWGQPTHRRPISELSIGVPAPAARRSVQERRAGEVVTRRERSDPPESTHGHGGQPTGGSPISQLSGVVAAPADNRPIGEDGTRVFRARSKSNHVVDATNLRRHEPVRRGPITESPRRIASPTVDAMRAHVWAVPVATAMAPTSPSTKTGAVLDVVEPSPSWPAVFLPQHDTLVSGRITQEWARPPSSCATPGRTGTGAAGV